MPKVSRRYQTSQLVKQSSDSMNSLCYSDRKYFLVRCGTLDKCERKDF